ncbi:MAG: hypothetical protein ACM3ZQ_01055 [Bacillota bacterium]
MTRARKRVLSELLSIVLFFAIMIGAAVLAEGTDKVAQEQQPKVVVSSTIDKSF